MANTAITESLVASSARAASPALREATARWGLVLLTVALSVLSLPGGPLPALGLVSVVPLAIAVRGASPKAAAIYLFACAFIGWLVATVGLATAFSAYAQTSAIAGIIAFAAASACQALPYCVFGWISARLCKSPLQSAGCLTLIVSLFPAALPIDSTHALAAFPSLIQILDLGGQPLLCFVFYFFTWTLADAIVRFRSGESVRASLAVLVALSIAVPTYGELRLSSLRDDTSVRSMTVGVIQPNIPLDGDSDPHSADALNPFHTLIDMTQQVLVARADVDVVVWPETPLRIACTDEHGARPQLDGLLDAFRVPLLINCASKTPSGDYNTQLLLREAHRVTPYYKLKLFPFAEYLPGESLFPWLRALLPKISHYVPATEPVVFHLDGRPRFFVAICYEILFPRHVRPFVERGGEVLITPANDAWFGESRIPAFEVAESVFQAVQYRVPVVRVSNSGDSVAIEASGDIIPNSHTQAFTRASGAYKLRVPEARSPYLRWGDAFLYVLGAVLLLTFALDRRSLARRPAIFP